MGGAVERRGSEQARIVGAAKMGRHEVVDEPICGRRASRPILRRHDHVEAAPRRGHAAGLGLAPERMLEGNGRDPESLQRLGPPEGVPPRGLHGLKEGREARCLRLWSRKGPLSTTLGNPDSLVLPHQLDMVSYFETFLNS